MKYLFFFLLVGLIWILLHGCHLKKTEEKKLTDKIQYRVLIQNENSSSYYNIERNTREAWIEFLLKRIMEGEIQPCGEYRQCYDKNDLLQIFIENLDDTRLKNLSQIDTHALVLGQKHYFPRLVFEEAWGYDPSSFQISKEVLKMAFIYEKQEDDDGISIPLFWILPDTSKVPSDQKIFLTDEIEYSVFIKQIGLEQKWWMNNIESQHRDDFLTRLLFAAKQKKIKLYLNQSFGKQLSWEDIAVEKGYTYRDEESDSLIEKQDEEKDIIAILETISAIKFLESWSFDPSTLRLNKKVKALCLMKDSFQDDGAYKGIEPFFWLRFD